MNTLHSFLTISIAIYRYIPQQFSQLPGFLHRVITHRPRHIPRLASIIIYAYEKKTMAIQNAIASVAVNNLANAIGWYEKLFSRPADSTPMPEVAEWQFARGGWLQVYENRTRAGHGSITLSVSDLEGQINHLKKMDIDPGQPIDNKTVKVIMIKDPDGNSIAFAEPHDPTIAQ